MKKIFVILLVSLLAWTGADARGNKIDAYGRRHYNIAIGVTNPLSAFQKYGGQLETRTGNVSYIISYTKYVSAYPGTQFGFELQKYIRSRSRDQYYLYLKGVFGDAGLDTRKLSIYGDNSKILIGDFDESLKFKAGNEYVGGALGFGKRYNFNVLFIRWNLGVKFCTLGDLPEDEKHMYRLMFATGPASILEFNVHLGLQL